MGKPRRGLVGRNREPHKSGRRECLNFSCDPGHLCSGVPALAFSFLTSCLPFLPHPPGSDDGDFLSGPDRAGDLQRRRGCPDDLRTLLRPGTHRRLRAPKD
jgi:hypothetical protein